jgi:DNA repair photolyase
VEFIEMPVKQILNRCSSPRMPFRWTINPYRGCEFGCVYCYARYTHEFLEQRDPMAFERRIFVKKRAAEALARNLTHTALGTDRIAIGTATDPYQPAERKFGLTRSMLEVFVRLGGINLSITTKSTLIIRDIELLRTINERSNLMVNFSLVTLSRRLQRVLEPRAPRPALRLRAIKALSEAGIRCNVLVAPVIPGITDHPAALENVIRMARWAGASAVWWRSLYLMPAAARRFLPFIREHFPAHRARFQDYYGRNAYAPADYDAQIAPIFDELRRKYGFETTRADGTLPAVATSATGAQLTLY